MKETYTHTKMLWGFQVVSWVNLGEGGTSPIVCSLNPNVSVGKPFLFVCFIPRQRRSKWTWKAPSSPMENWTVWAPAAPATWTTTAAGRAPSATRATPPAVTNWPSPLENTPACTFTTPAAVFYGFHLSKVPARRSVLCPAPAPAPPQFRLTALDGRDEKPPNNSQQKKNKQKNSRLVQLASL